MLKNIPGKNKNEPVPEFCEPAHILIYDVSKFYFPSTFFAT